MSRQCCLVALIVVDVAISGQAAIVTYTDPSLFAGSLQDSYANNFSALSGGATGLTLSFSGGSPTTFSYQLTDPVGTDLDGFYVQNTPPTGITGKAVQTYSTPRTLTIDSFSANVTAIGGYFFFTDAAGALKSDVSPITVSVNGTAYSFTPSNPSDATKYFFGFTTDAGSITSLAFSSPDSSHYSTVGDLTVGSLAAVPEAGGWVAGGFLGVFVVGRSGFIFLRRCRQATWQQ